MQQSNLFVQPASWADRKLAQLKAHERSSNLPFVFLTSCISCDGSDIDALRASEEDSTLEEMRKHCDLAAFEAAFEYGPDLPLEDDWHIGVYRSTYRGVPCFFIDHSRIEYIWVDRAVWLQSDNMSGAQAAS